MGATLERTAVPFVPLVVEEQVAEEALVSVETTALLQEVDAHLSLKLGVATDPTEFVSPTCKLAKHAGFAITRPVEVGEGFGLVPDIACVRPKQPGQWHSGPTK